MKSDRVGTRRQEHLLLGQESYESGLNVASRVIRKEERETPSTSIKLVPFILFQRPSPVNINPQEDNISSFNSPDRE